MRAHNTIRLTKLPADLTIAAGPNSEVFQGSVSSREKGDLVGESLPQASGEWKMTVEEFSFAGCHYNSSCD
jgi:hypothetical protein